VRFQVSVDREYFAVGSLSITDSQKLFQVGVDREHIAVGSLSLRAVRRFGRAGVRGLL
jgi:hypothetical protein